MFEKGSSERAGFHSWKNGKLKKSTGSYNKQLRGYRTGVCIYHLVFVHIDNPNCVFALIFWAGDGICVLAAG